MKWFGRRRVDSYWAATVGKDAGIKVLRSDEGWTLLSDQPLSKPKVWTEATQIVVAPGDLAGLIAALPVALRRTHSSDLTGLSGLLDEDVVRHPLVGDDWLRATAAGVRLFTVMASTPNLTVLRRGLDMLMPATAPSVRYGSSHEPRGVGRMNSVGDGPTAKLQRPVFDDFRTAIDDDGWLGLPVWESVAEFLTANADAPGLVSAWWVPDIDDPSRAPGLALRPEHAKEHATLFLNGTEEPPDLAGPPGVGFADPGVTGRWLWLHRWTPFDGRPPAEAFTGAAGLVAAADGTVRCFLWPDRGTVRSVRVRGQDRWTLADRSRVSGIYREFAGANDLPDSWRTTDPI